MACRLGLGRRRIGPVWQMKGVLGEEDLIAELERSHCGSGGTIHVFLDLLNNSCRHQPFQYILYIEHVCMYNCCIN